MKFNRILSNTRFVLSLLMLVAAFVLSRYVGSNGVLFAAVALPSVVPTFPKLAFPKVGKKDPAYYPGKLSDAMHAQQTKEVMASDKDIVDAVIALVKADVENLKGNVLLGEYYLQFKAWDMDVQNAHLNMLAQAQGVELLSSEQYEQQQRHIGILYAMWPELLKGPAGKGISDSKAAKRYSRAMADYRAYNEEQTQSAIIAKAEELIKTGKASEEEIKEMLETGNIANAEALASAISANVTFVTDDSDDKELDSRDPASLKNFVKACYANANSEERKVFARLCGLAKVTIKLDVKKINSWFTEAAGATAQAASNETPATGENETPEVA